MIATLFTWIVITYTFLVWGELIIRLISTIKRERYSFVDTIIIGLCACGSLIAISSLFFPSGIAISAILTGVAVISHIVLYLNGVRLFNMHRAMKGISAIRIVLCVIFIISLLLMVSMPPQLPDTLYYHIQNIMWNDQYSIVYGLGNLHDRFGFNSNILLIFSTFGYKAMFGQYIYGINALFFALFFIDIIIYSKRSKPIITVISLSIVLLFFIIYKLHLASASTDFVVNILIVYLLIKVLRNHDSIKENTLLFWLIPIFSITLKLSLIPICLSCVCIAVYLYRNRQYKLLISYFILGCIIILPWLARNIIISGYLIYPLTAIDIFDVDWKVPIKYAIESKNFIQAYAISIEAFDATNEVLQYPLLKKITLWISEQSVINLLIGISSTICFILSSIFIFSKRNWHKYSDLFFFWVTILAAYLFWMIMAPDIRFALGILCGVIAIPIYLFADRYKIKISHKYVNYIGISYIALISIISYRYFYSIKDPQKSYSSIIYKPQGMELLRKETVYTIYAPVTINNLRLYIPLSGCIDCELPCSRDYIDNIEMRGPTLQEGFRGKK